jgi:hypothetical protein
MKHEVLGLKPMLKRDPLVMTQSDMKSFKSCRRAWMLGSYLGLELKTTPPFGPLALGSRVHKALEGYYGEGRDLLAYYTELCNEQVATLEESGIIYDTTAFWSEADLGRIMLEGYLEWLEETGADADYEVIGTEEKLEYPLREGTVLLRGKVDLRVRRKSDGARLVFDHKTTANFANLTTTADLNEQLLTYMVLERLVHDGEPDSWADGMLFNMLRKVKRSTSSRPPYFERFEVRHNDTSLRMYWIRLHGVVDDYVRVVQQLDEGLDHRQVAYPNPGSACRYCPFKHPCRMMDDGSRVEELIDTLYRQHDPHERYETEPAEFIDEVSTRP